MKLIVPSNYNFYEDLISGFLKHMKYFLECWFEWNETTIVHRLYIAEFNNNQNAIDFHD